MVASPQPAAKGPRQIWGGAALAALFLYAVLILPAHPAALTPRAIAALPLEWPALLLLLALTPRPLHVPVRALTAVLALAIVQLKLADVATELAYSRAFNPILDAHLLHAVWMLMTGAIGVPATIAAAISAIAASFLVAVAAWWSAARIQDAGRALNAPVALAVALVPALALPAADHRLADLPGSAATSRLADKHARAIASVRADLREFSAEAARDPFAAGDRADILGALRGHDVFVIFIESYGRSALDNPRYRPTTEAALGHVAAEISDAGLVARSAYLTAPMVGGQSWLSHASVLSGLWIDNQLRYEALIASPRRTLLHYAAAAGWRTVGVMPAITLPWPEAGFFGFDAVYEADDLGYAGTAFNWVTMPDQYTLAALERLELDPAGRPPVFAKIALISSHAPWTPIPPVIDWAAVGDGQVFDRWATSGDPPDVVWRDRDRVRDQYRKAIAYALAASGGFAARRADTAPLFVITGDHQPAPFVSQDDSRDVPIHLVGPPELIRQIDGWNWTEGMVPAGDAPAWRMDAFRDRFLAAYATPSGLNPPAIANRGDLKALPEPERR